MVTLLSNGCIKQSVPESYILPLKSQPGKFLVPVGQTIPIIDIQGIEAGHRRNEILSTILKASEEFGFYQVINHGVSTDTMNDMMSVATEFFQMPDEDKTSLYCDDPTQAVCVKTSIDYDKEDHHYWRDVLKHSLHPLEENMQLWPSKPARYREVVAKYFLEVRKLGLKLLDLYCEGLGLEKGFFEEELTNAPIMAINHYPLCPDPSLVLGLPGHADRSVITMLLQGLVSGLQVFKDGEWVSTDPNPEAFVINIGSLLEFISNGRLKSAVHRAVTNSCSARTSVATAFYPSTGIIIEPLKQFVTESKPPMCRAFKYEGSEMNIRQFKL